MHADPRDARSVIEQDAMTWRQMLIVLLCVLLNGLDGFDVLSISFASPGIAAEFMMPWCSRCWGRPAGPCCGHS